MDIPLLMMDEPFSNLDPVAAEAVIDILHNLGSRGVSVLVTEHRMEFVHRGTDRLMLMDDGVLVNGDPDYRVELPVMPEPRPGEVILSMDSVSSITIGPFPC